MKTVLVRPILVETKNNENRIYPCILKHSCFSSNPNGTIGYYTSNIKTPTTVMELVLTSLDPKEKIKVGDLVVYTNPNTNRSFLVKVSSIENDKFDYVRQTLDIREIPLKWAKKVIASQDKISPQDIQKVIKYYSDNGGLKDIEIEIEAIANEDDNPFTNPEGLENFPGAEWDFVLTNGFVTIVEKSDIEKQADLVESIAFENLKPKPTFYTEEDVKDFGLFLGNNIKKFKNKKIDELFNIWLNG